jgi:hypothetical protein
MKPFQGTIDLEYIDIIANGEATISGNWLLVNSDNPFVTFVDTHPTLTAKSNLPEGSFKEDVNLTIEIKSKNQTEKSVT